MPSNHSAQVLGEKQAGVIADFLDPEIAARLMSMGLLPGTHVYIVRKSPFAGAYYINANGRLIALRRSEANQIVLK